MTATEKRGAAQPLKAKRSGRRRGQGAGLTLDQIADAALALVEAQGMSELSMRSLAARLGVAPSALYNHVADRTALVDLVLERVLGGVDVETDPAASWRQQLTVLAQRLRDVLRAHPGIAAVLKGHDPTGDNSMRVVDAFARGIRRSGLAGPDAGHAWYTVVHYVIGFESTFTIDTRNLDRALDPGALAALHDRFRALDAEQYPGLHELGTHIWNPDLDTRFAYGLDVVLGGIATAGRS